MTQNKFMTFEERVELEKHFRGENVAEVDNIKSLLNKTVQWAEDRNLIKGSDSKSQCLKLVQEVGELSDSICKGKSPIDDIGDCLVVLTILATQNNLSVEECLAHAYNDIKDRKGKMVDGVFVKESDYA